MSTTQDVLAENLTTGCRVVMCVMVMSVINDFGTRRRFYAHNNI